MGVTYLVERGTRPGLNAALAWSAGALINLALKDSIHQVMGPILIWLGLTVLFAQHTGRFGNLY